MELIPRIIDKSERQRLIIESALRIIAEDGPSALTLNKLADELGGSITLVTHFYRNRAELLKGILDRVLADFDEELEQIESEATTQQRLRILLEWMLPLDSESLASERGRILLLSGRGTDLPVQDFADALEVRMTTLLRDHLAPLVSPDRLEVLVDTLRAFTNGVILSTVEHPGKWTADRQLASLDLIMDAMGLGDDEVVSAGERVR